PFEQEFVYVAYDINQIKSREIDLELANRAYTNALLDLQRVRDAEGTVVTDELGAEINIEDMEKRVMIVEKELKRLQAKKPYTHTELDPAAILGVAASIIPNPHQSQGPRNLFQCQM